MYFQGIDPKLDFASRTTVQEVTIPGGVVDSYAEADGYSSDISEVNHSTY